MRQLVAVVALVAFAMALLRPDLGLDQPVSYDFHNTPRVDALRQVASELGLEVTAGDGISGAVTDSAEDITAREAFNRLSGGFWKRVGDTLLVVPAVHEGRPGCGIRSEFLFEHIPAAQAAVSLGRRFPRAHFTPHPTLNGFYVNGTKDEILWIKRSLPELDLPSLAPPPSSLLLKPQHLLVEQCLGQLPLWVPEIRCREGDAPGNVIIEGRAHRLMEAALAFLRLDRPSMRLRAPRDSLRAPMGRCRIVTTTGLSRLDCPAGDCRGVLHELGLRDGDIVDWDSDPRPPRPMWFVERAGIRTNLYVTLN